MWEILAYAPLVILMTIASISDIKTKTIPDWISAIGIVLGFFLCPWTMLGPTQNGPWLSSLSGMTVGAGIFWMIRFSGSIAFKREAMGEGDLAIIAMIGSFLGWQACVVTLIASSPIGIAYALTFKDHELPYGPSLCLAALLTMIFWSHLSPPLAPFFQLW